MPRRWTSPNMAREGEQTGDGRVLVEGSVTWVDPPMPFMWDRDGRGHAEAVVIGLIEEIMREGNTILGAGTIDDVGEDGIEAIRLIEAGLVTGLSIDPDDYEVEIIDTTVEEVDGSEAVAAAAGDPDPGPDGGVLLFRDAADAVIERYTRLRIRGVTLVELPAFDSTQIVLEAADAEAAEPVAAAARRFVPTDDCTDDCVCHFVPGLPIDAIAAAAAPLCPPAAWFEQPDLDGPTPIIVTEEGRIYGHAAGSHSHLSYGLSGPRIATHVSRNYSHFNNGRLRTAEGHDVMVGQVTLYGGHPDLGWSADAAKAHYDDTRSGVADVAMGWDEKNNLPWFSGGLRPGVTDEEIRILRATGVSVDARPFEGEHLPCVVALLSVNVEGWPVIAQAASGALVASGAPPVRRMDPRDSAIAELRATVAAQGALLASLDVRTQPLIPIAHREALAASGALVTAESLTTEEGRAIAEDVLRQGLRRMAARVR